MTVNGNLYAAQMITQMALVQGSISTVGDLESATPVVLQTIYAAVKNAVAPFNAAIKAYDADIDVTSVGGVVVGFPPPLMAAQLLGQTTDVEAQGRLIVGRAYVNRIGININNAPG
jgi:hypothetical protein